MKQLVGILALFLVAAACSDGDSATETTGVTSTAAPTTTIAPATSTTSTTLPQDRNLNDFFNQVGGAVNSGVSELEGAANQAGNAISGAAGDVGDFFEGLGNDAGNALGNLGGQLVTFFEGTFPVATLSPAQIDNAKADAERRLAELVPTIEDIDRAFYGIASSMGDELPSQQTLLAALNSMEAFGTSRAATNAADLNVPGGPVYQSITFQSATAAAVGIGGEFDGGSGWNLGTFTAGGDRDCEVLGGALTVGFQSGGGSGLGVGFWTAPVDKLAGPSLTFAAGVKYGVGATAAIFYTPDATEYQGFVVTVGPGFAANAIAGGQAFTSETCPPPS